MKELLKKTNFGVCKSYLKAEGALEQVIQFPTYLQVN